MFASAAAVVRVSKTLLPFIVLTLSAQCSDAAQAASETKPNDPQWAYLDNGILRIGVDRSRGACICFLAESATTRNVVNHFDEGRNIQQSYYGAPDGSSWNGKPWVYNPVQGGSWRGDASRLLDFRTSDTKQTLYAKVEPCRWSSGIACPEAIMQQWISLNGRIAHVRFKMTYTGKNQAVVKAQEMPAVFVDAQLKNLVYVDDGELNRRIPNWPNESGTASENWLAYVNENDWGIGIYTPGTNQFTCYRARGDGMTGPEGSACSYVAPLRRFSLQKGQTVEYDVYLTLGTLEVIRSEFAVLGRLRTSKSKQ